MLNIDMLAMLAIIPYDIYILDNQKGLETLHAVRKQSTPPS